MTRTMRTRPVPKNEARWTRRKPLVLETLEDRTVPSFLPGVHYDIGKYALPQFVAAGDLNADGILDFATANFKDSSLGVHLGVGDGTFTGMLTLPTGLYPMDIAIADLDGDGCGDLLNNSSGDAELSVHLSNCDGTFQPRQNYAGVPEQVGITVADFNLDGILDVATGYATILFGLGDGTFGTPTQYPLVGFLSFAADLNADGASDLIVPDYGSLLFVLLNNGDGTFAAPIIYDLGTSNPLGVAVADLNLDGILDLAVGREAAESVYLLFGNGDGTFQPPQNISMAGTMPACIVAADLDLDGDLDLALTTRKDAGLRWMLNNGDGTFQTPQTLAATGDPVGLVAGDFNADGYPDLLAAHLVGLAGVYLNDASWGPAPQGGSGGREVSRLLDRLLVGGNSVTPVVRLRLPMYTTPADPDAVRQLAEEEARATPRQVPASTTSFDGLPVVDVDYSWTP